MAVLEMQKICICDPEKRTKAYHRIYSKKWCC